MITAAWTPFGPGLPTDSGKEKVIALTFDDGPSDEYSQEILDLLKK